jgi:hypothetical protein
MKRAFLQEPAAFAVAFASPVLYLLGEASAGSGRDSGVYEERNESGEGRE